MKRYWIMGIFATPLLILAAIYHDNKVVFILGTIELFLIAIVINLFVIMYSQRNWKANPYGRALMYSKISLAILVNLSLATGFLGPDWTGRGFARLVLFGAILFAQARLLQLLFSVKTQAARDEYFEAIAKILEKKNSD